MIFSRRASNFPAAPATNLALLINKRFAASLSSPLGEWNLASGVFGYCFLVLAIEILGNWKAINITLASLFFAAFFALSNFMVTAFSGSWNNPINSKAFYNMLPYLLAFLSLIVFSKKSHAPKAEGIPYDKSSR